MRSVRRVVAVAAASALILAGCSSQITSPSPGAPRSGYHRAVTGILVRAGGPPPGSVVPLPGKVEARNQTGEVFTAATGSNGRFQLSPPPGTYQLTGHSPQVMINGRQGLCIAARALHLTRNKTARNIQVVCSIS